MAAIYMSEVSPDSELWNLPKYRIGDKVRICKITLTKNDAEDTKEVFLKALGSVWEIKDISLWETNDTENPYFVTYEVEIGNMYTIFLSTDEIEPAEDDGNEHIEVS